MEPVPKVYTSQSPASPVSPWKKRLPFLIAGVLILIIILEVFFAFQTFYSQNQLVKSGIEQITSLSSPQLVATTTKPSFQIGETVPVTIKVVTGGQSTDSTDVILRYDPKVLEITGDNFVEIGRIYPDYPVANYDNITGIVQVSGAALSSNSGFSGVGNFATLNFKAMSAGATTISIDFQTESTADSNIVLSGTAKDILTQVTNADIIIEESSSTIEQASKITSCSGFYQYCQVGDQTGKQFCQKGALVNNQCSFDPELTISCSECLVE